MAKVRQILKHVSVEVAKGKRHCRRNREHCIEPGQACLVIRDDGGPYTRQYCAECAEAILKLCAEDLREFGAAMFPDRFWSKPVRPEEPRKSVPAPAIFPGGPPAETGELNGTGATDLSS